MFRTWVRFFIDEIVVFLIVFVGVALCFGGVVVVIVAVALKAMDFF